MDHTAPRLPSLTRESFSLDPFPIVKADAYHFSLKAAKHSDAELDEVCCDFIEMQILVEEFLTLFRRIDKAVRKGNGGIPGLLRLIRSDLLAVGCGLIRTLRRTRFGPFFPKTRRRFSRQIRYAVTKDEPKKSSPKPPKQTSRGWQTLEQFIQEGGMTLNQPAPSQDVPLLSEAIANGGEKTSILAQSASHASFFCPNSRPTHAHWRSELTKIRTIITENEI